MASPIDIYHDKAGVYPANNKQWWIAKRTSDSPSETDDKGNVTKASGTDYKIGDFDPALLQQFYFGNSRAPRGHFVVNAFNLDRSLVSGVAGLPVINDPTRPRSIAFFAGRVWYAHNSTVYFSQILDNIAQAGNCFQEADPTAEDISDLIDTDGGVIPIPESVNIVKLVAIANGLAIFATNGIWFISGSNSGFTATSFSVAKINSIGTDAPDTIVECNSGPNTQILWWSRVGIQGMSQSDQVTGQFQQLNLTETSIQTFYNAISDDARQHAKGVYDPATNIVQWVYGEIGYFYNKVLTFDLTLGAFYPWSITSDGQTYITGIFTMSRLAGLPDTVKQIPENYINFTIQRNDTTGFGYFWDPTFWDFGYLSYESYVVTGYELLEDAMRNKEANYVFCYFRRTEDTWFSDGHDDAYLLNTSSCTLQTRWDWSSSAISNQWSRPIEVYRLRQTPFYDDTVTQFDNGYAVVVTKNKVRGHGKSVQYRFSCDTVGRNFDLLGWAVNYTGNTKP